MDTNVPPLPQGVAVAARAPAPDAGEGPDASTRDDDFDLLPDRIEVPHTREAFRRFFPADSP
jgi:hypothetical protein